MTYESALQWAIDSINMNMFESFTDWYDAVELNFQTPSLTDNMEFINMAKEAWEKSMGEIKPEIIRDGEQLPFPEKVEVTINIQTNEIETIKPQTPIGIPISVSQQESERILPETGKSPELVRPIERRNIAQRFSDSVRAFLRRIG